MPNTDMFISARSPFAILLVFLVFLSSTGQAEAQDRRKYLIDSATTAISGINISMKEDEIIKALGRPKSEDKGFSDVMSKPSKYLYYDGMTLYLIDGEMYNLSCRGEQCQTDRGVKIGDSRSKVIEMYGAGNPPYAGSKRNTLSYPFRDCDIYLIFLFEGNRVIEIEFWFDFV